MAENVWLLQSNRRLNFRSAAASSVLLSLGICALIAIGFLLSNEQFTHWFIVPITLCGVVIGVDAVDWLRGRLDAFDPVGVLGLLGLHFFFLAPLLHVAWDYWMLYIIPPNDWRPWLGYMAILNFFGLLVYRFTRSVFFRTAVQKKPRHIYWELNRTRLAIVLVIALTITGLLQIWVYQQQGGISGYIASYESRLTTAYVDPFKGMGWIFAVSESFPILAMIGFAVYFARIRPARMWPVLILVLFTFLVLQLLFGGLRGSRSNTIWSLFWAVGIIHFWIRPIPRKIIYIGACFILLFMYLYGFYKSMGLNALEALATSENFDELERQTGRTREAVLLGDLARSDVQAFLLYRLTSPKSDYEYAWGRTYSGALAILVPQSLWPDRPPTKVKEGTDAQYGLGTYTPYGTHRLVSSRVYGLAGETMLNFGPIAIPFAFVVLGGVVGWTRRRFLSWPISDSRYLLLPLLVNFCFVVLASDSDNILFFLIKSGALPFLVVILGSKIRVVQE